MGGPGVFVDVEALVSHCEPEQLLGVALCADFTNRTGRTLAAPLSLHTIGA